MSGKKSKPKQKAGAFGQSPGQKRYNRKVRNEAAKQAPVQEQA